MPKRPHLGSILSINMPYASMDDFPMPLNIAGFELDDSFATIAAALIAAMCSSFSLLLLILNKRSITATEHYADEKRETRKKMRELVHHLNQVEASTRNLIFRSERLTPQELVQEATHTLAIVSDYFRATASDKTIDFPNSLLALLESIRGKIAGLFLSLDISSDREKDIGSLDASMRELSSEIDRCRTAIRDQARRVG
jgi:hypothetical protein